MERITRPHIASQDPDTVEAVERSLPIVAQLAAERAKPWPRRPDHIVLHKQRIGSLVSELRRTAEHVEGMTADELEALGVTELRRRGRSVPRAVAPPEEPSAEARAARADLGLLRELLETERQKKKRQDKRVRDLAKQVAEAEHRAAAL
jgi:hypothetical protein